MKKSPLYVKLIVLIPLVTLVILLLVAIFSPPKKIELIPSIYGIEFWPWAETSGGDSSKIVQSSFDENGIQCSYILNNNAPYAGFTMNPSDKEFWDISEYDYIEITFDTEISNSTQLSLSYFLNGFSKKEKWQTLRLTVLPLYSISKERYQIPFREIPTPAWWYRENNIQRKDVPAIDYRQLANIGFVNGESLAPDTEHTIAVKSITFIKEPPLSTSLLATLLGIYTASMVLFFLFTKRSIPLPKLKKLEITNHVEEEYTRVSTFLSEHYHQKDLSLSKVAEQTGVTSGKISQLLQRYHQQSYSQFLNSLRLTEAKRLLKESDRNVSEIASYVGYGYVNSFNRVFKEAEGKTPLEYRGEKVSH